MKPKINKCISPYCTSRKICFTRLQEIDEKKFWIVKQRYSKVNLGSGTQCRHFENINKRGKL